MSKKNEPLCWLLNPLFGSREGGPVQVEDAPITLGRDPSNTIAVPEHEFPGVSAHHARVTLQGRELVIEDLGSKNGTRVGGKVIERRTLEHGDVIELGTGGPRFVALSSSGLGETVQIPRSSITDSPKRSIGAETIRLVRRELGISPDRGVQEMLQRRARRQIAVAIVLVLVLVAGGAYALYVSQRHSDESVADIQARTDELARGLEEQRELARSAIEAQRQKWARQAAELELARATWEQDKSALQHERSTLESGIARLEEALAEGERNAAEDLDELRSSLLDTSRKLEMYDPVNLEVAKLARVRSVKRCVVMIEATQRFLNEDSGKPLFVNDLGDGTGLGNFNGEGEMFALGSTGSGFCFTDKGWVLTNAHVVKKKSDEEPWSIGPEVTLVPEVELTVVFSGESERHSARLVSWASEDVQDMALLKIEPFEGMPYLPAPDTGSSKPEPGTEVYLIGFPLGKNVFHSEDALMASAFRGIVSRVLDYYVQVDAAVHPGASGGPLIDGQGNILGVVVGMQALEQATSSAIGYIIPISEASDVWPPPENALGDR